jgi:hypothetical protein
MRKTRHIASRVAKLVGGVILAPLGIALVVFLLPLLFLLFAGHFLVHLWYVARLRASWPPDRFVLIAYTESELWAPYIERELLPQLQPHCIAINRSRENWKRQFPIERRALGFWGAGGSYNPIVIVLRPWARVRIFRLYEHFKELKHGRPSRLQSMAADLIRCVQEAAKVGA